MLREWEADCCCEEIEVTLALRFQKLVSYASEQAGKRCVVLVAEIFDFRQ